MHTHTPLVKTLMHFLKISLNHLYDALLNTKARELEQVYWKKHYIKKSVIQSLS